MTKARSILCLLTAAAAAACGGYSYQVESNLESESIQGSLSQDAFTLRWEEGASWETGHCLDFTLQNNGRPVWWWTLTVTANAPITELGTTWNATVTADGDQLVISPLEGALDYGESVTFQQCGEPRFYPTAITAIEWDGPEPTPTPTATVPEEERTPTPVPETPEPTPGGAASVKDEPLFLIYRHSIESRGGHCLDIELLNGGTQDLERWSMSLSLTEDAVVTDWWGAFIPVWWSGNRVDVLPDEWAADLAAYESVVGTLCLSPQVDITGMTADVTYAEPDEE